MTPSFALARALQALTQGEKLPASALRQPVVQEMIDNGVLQKRTLGAGRHSIAAPDAEALQRYIHNHFGIGSLEAYLQLEGDAHATRADAVLAASSSKIRSVRSFGGFLVQSLSPIAAILRGEPITVAPLPGTCLFVQDWPSFVPAPEVTIVGIENGENFQRLSRYGHLFAHLQPLFISRYPQSADGVRWLSSLPNPYLHFGDLDFEGIRIFLHEYRRHLSARAQFFVPPGAEDLLQRYGNRALYTAQSGTRVDTGGDAALDALVALFHRYGKVLEQEVFVEDAWG